MSFSMVEESERMSIKVDVESAHAEISIYLKWTMSAFSIIYDPPLSSSLKPFDGKLIKYRVH